MGCRISKSDEPTVPVLLCRERRDLIGAVEDRRRALALAHKAYFHALSRVGDALLLFVQHDLSSLSSHSTLTLPTSSPDGKKNAGRRRPGSRQEPDLAALSDSSVSPFHSSCASLEMPELQDDEDDAHCCTCSGSDCDESTVREPENAGFVENPQWLDPNVSFNGYPGLIHNAGMPNYRYHYMQSSSTVPTTVYQQAYGDNSNRVYMDYGYGYGYNNYPMYGFNLPPEPVQMQHSEKQVDSGPPPPPPPPPVPTVSGWDFFNPFDSYQQSLDMGFEGKSGFGSGSIRSSSNSSEVREREGIPELEEDTERESFRGGSKREVCSSEIVDEETADDNDSVQSESENVVELEEPVPVQQVKPTSDRETNAKMRKVKKVSFEEDEILASENRCGDDGLSIVVQNGSRKVEEVVREIKEEFGSLVSCGAEVAKLLEVHSTPYRPSSRFLRLWRLVGTLLASATKFHGTGQLSAAEKLSEVEFNDLSSILDRLHAWEKRLYKEVKEEEKLRLRYEREWKRLKILDDKGAEASKIDSTRTTVRSLSTQLNIAMREIKFISTRIQKLRDDELQPSLASLFQGLMRLWRLIFESHHKQLQAVLESKPDRLVPEKNSGTNTSSPSVQLELELINWSSCFSNWIRAQISYVHSLNQYLLKWLPHYKEATTSSSCSPMSIGAPPVFVLSNDWARMAEKVSECNVTDKIQAFALSVHLLQERQDLELQQKIRADFLSNDLEKRMRHLNSDLGLQEGDNMSDGKMVALEGLKNRLDLERAKHKDAAKLVQEASTGNLKAGLGPIFKALESFSMEVLKGFEEVRFPISINP